MERCAKIVCSGRFVNDYVNAEWLLTTRTNSGEGGGLVANYSDDKDYADLDSKF